MAFLTEETADLILGIRRQIRGTGDLDELVLLPNVTISEDHTDEAVVTEHPVDYGANVADHAYMKPARVVAKFGWSNSANIINSVFDYRAVATGSMPDLSALSPKSLLTSNVPNSIYETLLALMNGRQLLDLVTKKRRYPNVLITKLNTVTDASTENCLIIEVTFTEVFITTTWEVDYSNVADPTLSPTANRGTAWPLPASPNSQNTGGIWNGTKAK